jgi:hypothetical protein
VWVRSGSEYYLLDLHKATFLFKHQKRGHRAMAQVEGTAVSAETGGMAVSQPVPRRNLR